MQEVKFEDLSNINYRMFLSNKERQTESDDNYQFLVVDFSGKYRDGSQGNNDSKYMELIVKSSVQLWNVDGLILDFSKLSYKWGNDITNVLFAGKNIKGAKFPVAIIVSSLCKNALESLGPFYINNSDGGYQTHWLFEDMESASNYLTNKLNNSN